MSKTVVYDGFGPLLGGMNASLAPSLISDGQAANLQNVACRGGQAGNRPALVDRPIVFDSPATQAAYTAGNFQGAGFYACPGDTERMFVCVAGILYRLTLQADNSIYIELFMPQPVTYTPPQFPFAPPPVSVTTPDPGNNPLLDRVYMCQADNWLVVQDGQSPAYLVQQNIVRRADLTKSEVPVGTCMAYGFGRLWVANGPNSYLAGDLLNEETDAVIQFTDQTYLAENSSFGLPPKFGRVRGMAFYDQQDTATGQGPLMVFGEHGAESVAVSLPRTSWQTSQIQVEALTNIGALGDRSIVNVNGDLFFRSSDGIRSYRQARGQQGLWGQLPFSTGVRPYIDTELSSQLVYGSSIFFGNRLITTCTPVKGNLYTTHAGLLSLDFDPIASTIGVSTQPPAWDGFWIPPRPVAQLLSGVFGGQARAFAFTTVVTYNADGTRAGVTNGISEIVEGQGYDDAGTPIASVIETRSFTGGSAGFSMASLTEKRLVDAEVFQVQRLGNTALTLEYRQDGSPAYQELHLAKGVQTTPTAITINPDGSITDAPPLFTVENRSDHVAISGNAANTRLNERFREVQFRITFTGSQKIKALRLKAFVEGENARSGPTA